MIERLLGDHQWSPEQINLHLKEDGILEISHEKIYQHIILDKQTGGDLHTYLRERVKRRKRYGSGKERRGRIPSQVSIDERPASAEARLELTDQGMASYALKTAYLRGPIVMGLLGGNPTCGVRAGRPSAAGSGHAVFMAKLAALVPRPRTNLTGPPLVRFYGVLARGGLPSNSRYR